MNSFDENEKEIIEAEKKEDANATQFSASAESSDAETNEIEITAEELRELERVMNKEKNEALVSNTAVTSPWENSSYIREYSPETVPVTETSEAEPADSCDEATPEGTSESKTGGETSEDKSENRIKETIRKSRFRRWIAVAVICGVFNLAVLSGFFALGYFFGAKHFDDESKDHVLTALNEPARVPEKNDQGAVQAVASGQELTTVEISKKVGPAVVGVTSTVETGMSIFGGSAYSEGTASGIIISADGYIVTNHHVIEGANSVSVMLNTGSEYEAEVIGSDSKTDLAVLKISPNEQLTVAELGDSSAIEVGERAIAIGNPLGMEFFGSTTQGIISAINRTITVDNKTLNVIQTDAAINGGNSGGALVNAYGQVIGINAVKISSSSVEGMGFAIPISEAKPIISDLIEFGYVKGRPVIGVTTRDVTEYMSVRQNWPMGVQVMEVMVGTGAEIAGLSQGDIIVKADGQAVETVSELNKIKNSHKPGESIVLEVYKYETGFKTTVSVKLGEERPEQ